jgi:cobalt-zinc-cadmium efflux system protein
MAVMHDHSHADGHDHDHEHDHGQAPDHPHGDGHSHATRAFALGTLINLAYTVVEAVYGFRIDSLALLSDALHNFGDALGLALAWAAARLALREPTARHTYGWRRATQLSPLANAVLLVGFAGALIGESLQRFVAPPAVPGNIIMWVAAIGMAVNLGSAMLFRHDHVHDLNRRGAYLHLMADAGVSFAAVLAGLGMATLGWRWLDPALAVLVAVLIAATSWGLLRDSFRQAMDAVPGHLDSKEVQDFLAGLPSVQAVHHVHIWSIGSHEIALTAHIQRAQIADHDAFIDGTAQALNKRFGINHATLQIELSPGCRHDQDDPAPHH